MTSDDQELREQLAQLDPMPSSVPVDLPMSPRARQILERAMLSTEPTRDTRPGALSTPLWRRPALIATAAAALIALAVGGIVAISGDGGSSSSKHHGTTLALKTPDSGGGISMGSCITFSVDILKDVPLAFGGTVTQATDGTVTVTVDHWYKGGDADVVTIENGPANISVGTVEFTQGKRYLVTATNGVVNSCGLTGEATPDLTKAFEQAFPQ